jgi:hypothetical protein
VDPSEFPKVTPYLLDTAGTMCPRRLRREYEGHNGGSDSFARFRVRERFIDKARAAHAVLRTPAAVHFPTPDDLVAEEVAVFERCRDTYVTLFGTEAVRVVDGACDQPTVHHARRLRVAGFIDLPLEHDDGRLELRQLDFWARRQPADPLDKAAVKVAVLRLSRWAAGANGHGFVVRAADLINGTVTERAVDLAHDLAPLRAWFDAQHATLQSRIATDAVAPGMDCMTCRYVAGCPAHPEAGRASR